MSEHLTIAVATLYAELHDLTAYDTPFHRRAGSFSVKEIKGRRYWYHQRWVGTKRVQKLIGPEGPEVLKQIEDWKVEAVRWRRERDQRRQLVRSLKSALRMTTDRLSGRVIRQLSEAGVFGAGGILIGTHAFMTYGPMLGLHLAQHNIRTGDIDVGAVDVAVEEEVSFADAVQAADKDFFIVPARPGARISTALKYRGGEARVELLTPLGTGRPWEPTIIRSLGFGAQKAPFLDYLIDDPVDATYVAEDGLRVRVPQPARFALHKLIVAANRDAASQAKAMKDKAQAAELIEALAELRPADLRAAARDLRRRKGGYAEKAAEAAVTMPEPMRTRVLKLIG
jgi:hypothetical protein